MTSKQVQQAIEIYRAYLSMAGDEAQVANFDLTPTRGDQIRHLLAMCPQIEEFILDSEKYFAHGPTDTKDKTEVREKAMRWLGFMHGVFWSLGIFSINDMRKHNNPDCEVK